MSSASTLKSKPNSAPSGRPPAKNMVWVPSGTFQMGSDHHYPEEARRVGFRLIVRPNFSA
jgi:formylglycine-generating enzyme